MKMKNSCNLNDLLSIFEDSLTSKDIISSQILADISVAITRERTDMNMTQKQFADYLNVSQGMVSKWESSDYNFSIKTLAAVAEKLDLDLNVSLRKEINHYDATQDEHYFAIMSSEKRTFDQQESTYWLGGETNMIKFNPRTTQSSKKILEVKNSKQYSLMEG